MSKELSNYIESCLYCLSKEELIAELIKAILKDPVKKQEWYDSLGEERHYEMAQANELTHCIAYANKLVKFETENTGGNCMIDIIELPDGKCITISEDGMAVHESRQDWEEQKGDCLVWLEWRLP